MNILTVKKTTAWAAAGLGLCLRLLPVLTVLLALLWSLPSLAAETVGALISGPIAVGFTKSSFVNVNGNDLEASFKTFLEIVGRKRGYLLQPVTHIFDNSSAFEAAIKSGSIQVAVVDSWQFLTMDIHQHMQPVFVPADRDQVGRKYLLLTRQGSGLNSLADLRGKGLTKLELAGANIGNYWLNTLLLANQLDTQESFFGAVETVAKPTAAVLPVFFGKKSCCFVDQTGFDIMAELNPQVGRGLQVVASSETYLDLLVCLGNTGWNGPRGKEDCMASLSELHLEPAGQQILTLFKVSRLVPFEARQLDEVKKLRATCDQWLKEAKP